MKDAGEISDTRDYYRKILPFYEKESVSRIRSGRFSHPSPNRPRSGVTVALNLRVISLIAPLSA
jgi:hypothetical protein